MPPTLAACCISSGRWDKPLSEADSFLRFSLHEPQKIASQPRFNGFQY